jgi:pimeloyl-ACP methyl ester carboxylesterase
MPVPRGVRDHPVNAVRHVIYLHGFTSSPASSKAQRFSRELAEHDVTCGCPDFNEPSFETLTITRMIEQTKDAIARAPAGPVALIGSSLGAFVAVHAVGGRRSIDGNLERRPPRVPEVDPCPLVDRLILLAPALDFGGNRLKRLGDHGIEEWRGAGRVTIFHHAAGAPREIRFALYEDAARYDAFSIDLTLPTLVFQGRADETVDPESVARWARGRPSVDVRLVDDGHQLTASMDRIWAESAKLLGLSSSPDSPPSPAPQV